MIEELNIENPAEKVIKSLFKMAIENQTETAIENLSKMTIKNLLGE